MNTHGFTKGAPMIQLRFPIKKDPDYSIFKNYLLSLGILQRGLLMNSHVFAHAYNFQISEFEQFINQVTSSYGYQKLENNQPRQVGYLTAVLVNELKLIRSSIKDDVLGAV